jgi:hypothetical protein
MFLARRHRRQRAVSFVHFDTRSSTVACIQSDDPRAFCVCCGNPVVDDRAIWTFVPERVGATRTFPVHEQCFRRIARPEAVALLDQYLDSAPRLE